VVGSFEYNHEPLGSKQNWISRLAEERYAFTELFLPTILTSCMGSISCIRPERTNSLGLRLTDIYTGGGKNIYTF
jgi:hypothetical protein